MREVPPAEPFARFGELFARAMRELPPDCFPEPNAMSLATVGSDGRPSNRIVLLKGFDEAGFVFYTNFDGRKGRELLANPSAALCFHWPPLETQIRIEGGALPVSSEEANAYFATRPRGNQIGAWVSLQSQPIAHEGDLGRRLADFERLFEGRDIPRPPHWSGFRLVPLQFEFWHARPGRLHNREQYVRTDLGWRVETLYP